MMNGVEKPVLDDDDNFGAKGGSIVSAFDAFRTCLVLGSSAY